MSPYPCPICGIGVVCEKVRVNFETKVRGCEFTVPKAKVAECGYCGEGFFDAKEMKRWRDAFYKSLTDKQKIRLLGADGHGFLEGTDRADTTLIKRGLLVNIGGLLTLTRIGIKVKAGI